MNSPVEQIRIADLQSEHRAQMLRLVAAYYRDPQLGLAEELRDGDVVYYLRNDDDAIGSFLIVGFDHHQATIDGTPHRFTYLGLGCAAETPFAPLASQVKDDFSGRVPSGSIGVLHLSTRTPFAFHGIEKAFGVDVYPNAVGPTSARAGEVARYIKTSIHRHEPRTADEDPFLLKGIKKVRFTEEELSRMESFVGATPLTRYRLDSHGDDELIVFHMFEGS